MTDVEVVRLITSLSDYDRPRFYLPFKENFSFINRYKKILFKMNNEKKLYI